MEEETNLGLVTCGTCKHFVSYRVYYEDAFEPEDCGFCKHPQRVTETTNIDETCELHEPTILI